jgi:excinuclease UvrABC nuclease subunit
MGIDGAGLGEKRATELANTFGSLYAVITAPEGKLKLILKDAATRKFLQAVGRE